MLIYLDKCFLGCSSRIVIGKKDADFPHNILYVLERFIYEVVVQLQ